MVSPYSAMFYSFPESIRDIPEIYGGVGNLYDIYQERIERITGNHVVYGTPEYVENNHLLGNAILAYVDNACRQYGISDGDREEAIRIVLEKFPDSILEIDTSRYESNSGNAVRVPFLGIVAAVALLLLILKKK